MSNDVPIPQDWRLIPDPELKRRDAGRVLLGGSPFRLLRLSTAGSKQVSDWFAGAPIGTTTTATRLARRLLANGMAHPAPGPQRQPRASHSLDPEITIVIPVKDDEEGLITTLAGLHQAEGLSLPIIVVDDGSTVPVSSLSTGPTTNTRLLRNDLATGPGAARNRGFEKVTTRLVAFVDAGVALHYQDLLHLVQHLDDPEVVAAAPRVRSSPANDHPASDVQSRTQSAIIAHYEHAHSPLDLGKQPASVKPESRVSYVPSACLVIRSAVLEELEQESFAFDPSLRYGEDVDLEWRLNTAGTIRYDPSIVVTHPPRSTIAAFVRQRIGYGSAAAPLAERHGQVVAPFRSSPWTASFLLLVLTGHPALGSLILSRSAALTSKRLRTRTPDHQVEAIQLAVAGHITSGISLGQASIRSWWPAALVGLIVPGLRPSVGRLLSWGLLAKVWRHRQDENRTVQVAMGLLDDLSYGLGLWRGAWVTGSLRSLWPEVRSISAGTRY